MIFFYVFFPLISYCREPSLMSLDWNDQVKLKREKQKENTLIPPLKTL